MADGILVKSENNFLTFHAMLYAPCEFRLKGGTENDETRKGLYPNIGGFGFSHVSLLLDPFRLFKSSQET